MKHGGLIGAYKYRAVILDPVHGFIPVNEAEYSLLQSPFMRRLHDITQLGLTFLVYPGARHTRFEHSIGVMHLMGRFAEKIASIVQEDSDLCSAITKNCSKRELRNFIQLSRLTGLLHDIGHLPFSHQMEIALTNIESNRGISFPWSKEFNGKVHEYYTMKFIRFIGENLVKRRLKLQQLIQAVEDALFNDTGNSKPRKDVLDKLGLTEGSYRVVNQLISGTIDADRLDYVLRDSLHTGVVYGRVDIDRLIYALTIDIAGSKPHVMYDIRGLSSLEDMIDSRIKMYKWLYLHHKNTSFYIALTKILQGIIDNWDKIKPHVYPHIGDMDFIRFMNPDVIAGLIGRSQVSFDEHEFMQAAKILKTLGDDEEKRWASSIMERRDLLPVSIVKRLGDITLYASKRPQEVIRQLSNFLVDGANVSKLENELLKEYALQHVSKLREECGMNYSKASFTISSLSIEKRALRRDLKVKGTRILGLTDVSSHVRGIHYSASEPIVYVHVYSDDECEHLYIRRNVESIKEMVFKTIEKVVLN
ncbi:MAG: HD domain-containing protein [Desulfurococcales archaeon]|nr:HD domain-containing protein [Desulfurococcales archaeon]